MVRTTNFPPSTVDDVWPRFRPQAGRAGADKGFQPSRAPSADHAADDSDPEPRCWLQAAAESPAWSSASGNGSERDSDTWYDCGNRTGRRASSASSAGTAATTGTGGEIEHRRDAGAAAATGAVGCVYSGGCSDAGMAVWRRMEESWLREWAAGRGGPRHGAPAGVSDPAGGGRESDLGNAGEGLDLGGDVDAELRGRWGRGMSPIVQEWAQWPA